VTYVSTNDPPVLTAHGTKDPLVPFEQAEEFHAKLLALKVPSVLITIKDAGHGFNSRLLNERVGSFFAKYLLSKGAEIKDEVIPLKP
jgi:dipeptidyl aminopeptidase/acylaminoacyl peptidase